MIVISRSFEDAMKALDKIAVLKKHFEEEIKPQLEKMAENKETLKQISVYANIKC